MENLLMLRPVSGFRGYYVSKCGTVVSMRRNRPRFLAAQVQRHGYTSVFLQGDDGGKTAMVHRLVLESWVGPPLHGYECCHANGDRMDNRVENLRWDTRRGNFMDRDAHGTTARGERNGYSKLTEDAVVEIRLAAASGESHASIASRYDVFQSTVSDIVSGKRWAHVGGPKMPHGYFKRAKLTASDVREIRAKSACGAQRRTLAEEYGVSQPTISNVVNRDTWKNV